MLQRRELPWSRCMELLGSRGVGRIAAVSPDGPQIYPVNFTVFEDALWFRLPVHNAVTNQLGRRAVVAVQVDRIAEEDQAGWTIQVRGQAATVTDPELLEKVRGAWNPAPWALPGRLAYFRLPIREMSGREVGPSAETDEVDATA